VGINPCVKVPARITKQLRANKGYIPVKGTIDGHPFTQTLVPVKNEPYRLYVNGPMLKASGKSVGLSAAFAIEQDLTPVAEMHPMPESFRKKLVANKLQKAFDSLIPSRQKEIIRYLNYLKTEEAKERNIEKVILSLKKK
jgi:hypothetical protein